MTRKRWQMPKPLSRVEDGGAQSIPVSLSISGYRHNRRVRGIQQADTSSSGMSRGTIAEVNAAASLWLKRRAESQKWLEARRRLRAQIQAATELQQQAATAASPSPHDNQ